MNFSTFWSSCFYSLERRLFVLEYRKRHFPGLYCLKKKFEKWPFLFQNHELTPLEKCQFFDFLTSCFCSLESRFFVVEYLKRHFPGLYCLKKNMKNGHFWTKTMGYPRWKNVNFSTSWTSCLYSLESRFFVLEYRKRHFPGLYCLKKKVGKMAIFRPKPWVNPFGKMSIFRLFELLVFIA